MRWLGLLVLAGCAPVTQAPCEAVADPGLELAPAGVPFEDASSGDPVLFGSPPQGGAPYTPLHARATGLVSPDRGVTVTLYIDETVGPNNAVSREAFALVRAWGGYAKVGKFLLPYGLRLPDDDEFIRSFTGFSYFTADQGIELGFEPGPLQFAVALTNGEAGTQETNSGKQVTSSAALVFRNLRLGGSASRDHDPDGVRDVVGGFGGLSFGPIVLLGEVDYIRENPDAAAQVEQLAAYVEADILAARGVNLKATFGFFDPDLEFDSGTQRRSRFGLEVFPVPFVRIAGFYTLLDFDQGGNDRDRLSIEAHVHF